MAQSWKAAAYRDTANPGQAKCLRRGLPFPYVPPRRDGGAAPKSPARRGDPRRPVKAPKSSRTKRRG